MDAADPMSRPLRMGGHFVDLFPKSDSFNWRLVPFILIWAAFAVVSLLWITIKLVVPNPRSPRPSEQKFTTVDQTGDVTDPEPLPCWYDVIVQRYTKRKQQRDLRRHAGRDVRPEDDEEIELEREIEPAEVFMTLVVPAFNEEARLSGMLEEAVSVLETEYGTAASRIPDVETIPEKSSPAPSPDHGTTRRRNANGTATTKQPSNGDLRGWEILLVDDGSTDDTLLVAQSFARKHILPSQPRRDSGPWTHRSPVGVRIPPGSIRMVSLEQNRGKGGAVTHGMRHARGQYVVFADADGASKFSDLGKLVAACREIEDDAGRGVAAGSRAHLVGSAAVVQRSRLRNFLMHAFHLLLRLLTPPATARIKDTQCGFKLFSRPTLPYIIPHMHMDGWIFDVEMLMLAEFAGIPVAEVAVGWREVVGSKLNVVRDSLGMAWGLALLRVCWGVGIYRR